MAEYLVIRPGPSPDAPVEWIVADDDGTRRSPPVSGPLADAAGQVDGRRVIVLVPALDVLTTTVDLPIRGGSKLNAALPFALEEHLADDIETLHFAAGRARENGRRPVTVVARSKMDAWLEQLAAAGIEASQLVAENYGLARIPGTMSMLIEGDSIMFNDGADVDFVMQNVKPGEVLAAAGVLSDESDDDDDADENEGEANGHLVVYCSQADEERLRHDWIALRQELHSVDVNLLPDGALPRLAVTVASDKGVNLLQGAYGSTTDYQAQLRPWRIAAMLLLGLLIVGVIGKGADVYRLGQEEATLRAQFAEEYRQVRPNDNREIVDPVNAVRSIKQGLGTSAGPQTFLPSLRQLSDAMSANASARIETISYRAGVIDVRIMSPDVATLDKIQKSVSASGRFQASIQSTDQVADQISSRLQIRESGS